MYLMYRNFIVFTFLLPQLFRSEGFDGKFEKNIKSVDLKHKLAKAEALHLKPEELRESDQLDVTEPISVLGITVPPEFANDSIVEDHHTYYNSTFYSIPDEGKKFWIDLESSSNANVHQMLSNSHRQATTVKLSFDFPFYGHILKNVTIATGGFLYMGDYLHNWIAATQYVAPLMANFDTSQSDDSWIKYADNGTAFTVEWKRVSIQDQIDDGNFTFQTTLMKNGDVVFAYKDIPYPIANISDSRHPVKIGISDAYILERSLFFVRRKTIYEYHRIDMLKREVSNNTAIYFTALPTCPGYKNCNSCMAADPKMECNWCEAVKRCSDGVDRQRQSWVASGCVLQKDKTCPAESNIPSDHSYEIPGKESEDKGLATEKSFSKSTKNPSPYNMDVTYSVTDPSNNEIAGHAHYFQEESNSSSGASTGAIVTIVVFFVALIAAGLWIGYAYKFPQTASGQFLIKYRPSQWSFKSKDDNSVSSSSRHL